MLPLTAHHGEQNNRNEQQEMRRLRERGQPDEGGGDVVRRRAGKDGAVRSLPLPCNLLVSPEEHRIQRQRDIEELGDEPHEVHGYRRDTQKRGGKRQRHPVRSCDGRDKQVDDEHIEGGEQCVKHQKPIRAEQVDERRRSERVHERLRKVQAGLALRVLPFYPSHEGKLGRSPYINGLAALQENSLRARKLLPDANEVLSLELKVEVPREAVREHVIGGFISLEPPAGGLWKIYRYREGEQQNAEEGRCEDARFRAHAAAPSRRATAPRHVM